MNIYLGRLLLIVWFAVTLCSGFAPGPPMQLRHSNAVCRSEPLHHCVCNAEASRITLSYLYGTTFYLALSTVNEILKSFFKRK